MYHFQFPYREVTDKNKETAKLYLLRNYRASEYFNFLPYLHEVDKSNFETSISDVINNRHYLQNYLLATGDISKSIQENLKSVITYGKRNDTIIRPSLDRKNKHILANPNPLQVTFKDIQNPIICKVLSQIENN